ncbi:MAG: xanthine dehydrogenase small subunit [Alphaproteobacteria bacterium]
MNHRNKIRLLLGFEAIEIVPERHDLTILEYLRLNQGLTGTKEGCAEGDCGACTVIVGELVDGRLIYSPVNACIAFLAGMDGKQILTVEHLSADGLHPVQAAMAQLHATQCGFCTPGFVTSIATLHLNGIKPDQQSLGDALAGNLCRCTGYGPILAAAAQALDSPHGDFWWQQMSAAHDCLTIWAQDQSMLVLDGNPAGIFIKPHCLADALGAMDRHKNATIYAGATDVGLWVSKSCADLPVLIHIGDVKELTDIAMDQDWITMGAGIAYDRALSCLQQEYNSLGHLIRRIGSAQVRGRGTIGGNIANGSPIGDMPPALMALGAEITLQSAKHKRRLALKDFFIEYGKQDRAPNEILTQIHIPRHLKGQLRCYKISKRFDQDITAVLGCFYSEQDQNNIIRKANLCYGGMAGIPAHAIHAQQAMLGQPFSLKTIEHAAHEITKDFKPLSDMRASAEYRTQIAANLLKRFYADTQSEAGLPLLDHPDSLSYFTEISSYLNGDRA